MFVGASNATAAPPRDSIAWTKRFLDYYQQIRNDDPKSGRLANYSVGCYQQIWNADSKSAPRRQRLETLCDPTQFLNFLGILNALADRLAVKPKRKQNKIVQDSETRKIHKSLFS